MKNKNQKTQRVKLAAVAAGLLIGAAVGSAALSPSLALADEAETAMPDPPAATVVFDAAEVQVIPTATETDVLLAPAEEPADIDRAMSDINSYAHGTYGARIDMALDLTNSGFRPPACAYIGADQATLEAKCRDMVDFTFGQIMRQADISEEQLQDMGIRCRVLVVPEGEGLLCYCLYA